MGDREIGVVSGRLPDNPGGLACMGHVILNKCPFSFLGQFDYSQLPLLRTLWGPRVSVLISESP